MAVSPVKQACSLAVMLRISGPDPKGRKMRQHAFFQSKNGVTTLSASGLCLPSAPAPNQLLNSPPNELLIITDASLIEPFIRQPITQPAQSSVPDLPSPFGPSSRGVPVRATVQKLSRDGGGKEELLPGTRIVALFDEESGVQGWHAGELVAVVDVPSATGALDSLLSSHSSIDSGGWQLGWHLVSVEKAPSHHSPPFPTVRSAPTSSDSDSRTYLRETFDHGLCSENPDWASGSDRGSMASRKGVGSGRIAAQTQDSAPKSRSSQGETVFETDANAVGGRPSRVRLAVLRVRVASAPKGSLSSLQSVSPPKASKLIGSLFQATSPAERLVPSWAPNPIDSRDSGDTNTPSRDPETEAPFLSSPPSKGAPSQSGLVSAGPLRRGDFLAAVGSPFGALSPGHFANSVSVGVVSNWWHAVQNRAPILLADMRCLPGMEGGPVVDGGGGVVGLLWRPLRQRNSGAEVQLIITSDALAPALRSFGFELLPRSSTSGNVASPAASQAARGPSKPAPQPAILRGVQERAGFQEAVNLLKSRFVGDGQSSARERHRAFSGPVASPVTHQEPLEMQPTSAASKNHSSTTSSQKNLGKRPTREPFHTGKSIHTPDAITAPFPAQLDMLEGIHTPEAVHIPGGLHTSSGLSAAAESAAESVVLLSVDDGAWASGVVLSAEGLILTNAHLIEPWRFAAKPKVHGSKMQQRVRFGEGVSETDERVKMTKRSGGADEEMVRKTGEQFWEGRETSRAVSERVRQRGTIGLETKWFEGEAVSREASRSTSAAAGFAGAQSAAGPSSSGGASKSVGADPLLPAERGGNSGGFEMRSDDRSDQRSAYWDWIGGAARRNPATCLEQSEPASEDSFSALGTFAGRLGSPAGVRDSTHYFDHFLGTENLHKSPYENAKHAARLDRESTSTQQSPQPHLRVEPLFAPPLSLRETASNPPRYYRPVKVRLSDRGGAATWQSARVVFVSQGPFDAAVLQLLNAPTGLRPIVPAERAPPAGATAVVVGHGLFGPMSELRPSVYSGVVSRLVKSDGHVAMLQTTAAVHPGGSGGAVVDVSGRLIGLVTSAARHSGGSMLPHLNFSIPVEALKPVFAFAKAGGLNVGLLEPLNTVNSNLSAIWALAPPPPLPRPASTLLPGHILENLPGQEDVVPGSAKGTKFAQFLTDRGQEFVKKSTLLRSKL